jgi:hypothetical protein
LSRRWVELRIRNKYNKNRKEGSAKKACNQAFLAVILACFLRTREKQPIASITSQQKRITDIYLQNNFIYKQTLVEAVTLGGGLTSDGEETSGFFKLQKIRTRGKL